MNTECNKGEMRKKHVQYVCLTITQNDKIRSGNRISHQSTIPSPTVVKRESVLGSMGRTCWQSGSFSRAVLIQFTKANRSSSVSVYIYSH